MEATERNKKMLRIRKLLAMGNDARGNEHETDAAMRMANKLMAELGIEEADVNMASLDNNTMTFGEQIVHPDGKEFVAGMQPKAYDPKSKWQRFLGVGVAEFCDCIAGIGRHPSWGVVIKFKGEREDVEFAVWLYKVLATAVRAKLSAAGFPSTATARKNGFKTTVALVLQHRLKALRLERGEMLKEAEAESGSRALVVIDRKQQEIVARFGEAEYTKGRGYAGRARYAGAMAGREIHIPTSRPLNAPATRKQIA